VLANTQAGGLRQDLSLKPDLLGGAFAAWADYKKALEDPRSPGAPLAAAGVWFRSLRRRYKITPPFAPGSAGIAPVLTYFYLLVGVRKQNATAPYTLSVRWAAALWNPYSSALVPEDLRLEISNLPESIAFYNATTGHADANRFPCDSSTAIR